MGRLGWLVFVCACRVSFDPIRDGGSDADDQGPQTYREAVLADAPIAYWRLGDAVATAQDETAHVAGSYVGSCTHAVGGALAADPDGAVGFDGATCEITLGDNFTFTGNVPYAVEVWIDASRTLAYEHYVTMETRSGGSGSGTPVDGWAVFRDNGPIGLMFERVIAGTGVKTTPIVIPANQWLYVVAVYDGAIISVYVDGSLIQTISDARVAPPFVGTALIGAHSQGAFFDGTLDEVAIYDHVLTPTEIQRHHTIGTSGPQ
jgi:hypothetical protein